MEVLICTRSKKLQRRLFSLTDRFLCRKKSRYMSVSSSMITNGAALSAAVKNQKAAIVILDVQSFENWLEVAEDIERSNRAVRICIVSGAHEDAAEAINRLKTVCGFLYIQTLGQMFKDVFARIYGRLRTVCGGIAITHYSSVDKIIPFEDIYFIETIKQTHLCSIVHKNGVDEIRADISKLIKELPSVFQTVRPSAIANMSEVKSCSDGELFFGGGRSCFCGKRFESKVIPFVKQPILL